MTNQKTIFLSYCHKDKDPADIIDKDLSMYGLNIRRDVRDVGYKDSFKEFMRKIRQSDHAIMLLSEDFLHSANCMYEMTELMKEADCWVRVLPVMVKPLSIFNPKGRVELIKYWQAEEESLNGSVNGIKTVNLGLLPEDLKKAQDISANVCDFISIVSDMKLLTLEEHKSKDYKEFLKAIEYDKDSATSKLMVMDYRKNLREKMQEETPPKAEQLREKAGERGGPEAFPKNKDMLIRQLVESLVDIPTGSFRMGSEDGQPNERPVHTVTLIGFKMGQTPVTQSQYEAVMGKNPSDFKGPDRPVEGVSWDEAKVFCERLSKETGRKFDLPTEAEWEYACRAGTTTRYYTGDSEIDLARAGWYTVNSRGATHPVKDKEKEANKFGLHDMHGNVWEWCNDLYSDKYYSESENTTDPQGPDSGSTRVLRGGDWINDADYCRSAARYDYSPGSGSGGMGFRVVRR